MSQRDEFAVWLAGSILETNDDEFGAAALADIGDRVNNGDSLDLALEGASAHDKRAGDFGVEFMAPLLPVLLVEFGRLLWDAYAKGLVEETGKALAKLTVDSVKDLLHRTFSKPEDAPIAPADVEAALRQVGRTAGLNPAQIEKLVETLHTPETVRALAGG